MKITPHENYDDARYPDLASIEKKIRLQGIRRKGSAVFAMAVATAMTMTMCGANAAGFTENASNTAQETSSLAAANGTAAATSEETDQYATALAGSIAIETTSLAGDIYMPEVTDPKVATVNPSTGNDSLDLSIAGRKMADEPTETSIGD